jgi:hypothetical protein
MATGLAGNDRAGQIFIQVSIDSVGEMGLLIISPPLLGLVQGEATIDDDPVRVIKIGGQFGRGN